MKTKKTFLALSPTLECMCLAAGCRYSWQQLHAAGNKLIGDVLARWCEESGLEKGIVIVPEISGPADVRKALRELLRRNVEILWVAPEKSGEIATACAGLKGVSLVTGGTLREAFQKAFGADNRSVELLRQLDGPNRDIDDFLRYKLSMLLMKSFNPEPLEQAVEVLARHRGGDFSLKSLPPADERSVENFRDNDFPIFEGKSDEIKSLKDRIIQVAPSEMGVLISGETGTGKEAIAFYIHEFSARRSGPFVCLNCAGLDETFLRSELFGHEKGAFTGALSPKKGLVELAEGGTLFLDELADMPLEVQADLLRFLQTKRYRSLGGLKVSKADIRIVAATQPVVFEKLESGEFRQDLFYRISEIVLHAPSLRDVPDDIIRVIKHIAFSHLNRGDPPEHILKTIKYFENGMDVLREYHWPGNVRELSAVVRRRLFLNDDVLPEIKLLVRDNASSGLGFDKILPVRDAKDILPLDYVASEYVRYVHAKAKGLSQKEIAKKLGKSVNTIKKLLLPQEII